MSVLKNRVRDSLSALAYITECNLATVSGMAMLRSRTKGEYNRQIAIAQSGCDWLRDFEYLAEDYTRISEVSRIGGRVDKWAEKYDIKANK